MAANGQLVKVLPGERMTGQRRVRPTETLGVPGVAIYGGYVEEKERSRSLATAEERGRTFSNILVNTSIVAAGVRYFVNLIGGATWAFTPSEADVSAEYAERAEAMLTADPRTPWHRIVRRASTYRFWGFGIQEWTARRREDGVITFLDVEPRSHTTIERWVREPHGLVLGVWQESPQTQEEIFLPREKLMYLVDDTLSDSPEGLGLFRHLVSPAQRLRRYEQLEGFGFETDLRGIPVGRVPLAELEEMVARNEISETEKMAYISAVRQFVENHIKNPKLGLVLDSATYRNEDEAGTPSAVRMWDVDLLTGTSQSFGENAAAIERLNREMARILGVEQLLLGADGKGSLALSKDKTHAFYLLVDGALTEVREAVETDLLGTLWRLNGWPPEMMPVLDTEAISYRDVEQIAATLRDMATAGAVLDPDDPVIGEVRDAMGVSRPDEVMTPDRADLGDPDDEPDMEV